MGAKCPSFTAETGKKDPLPLALGGTPARPLVHPDPPGYTTSRHASDGGRACNPRLTVSDQLDLARLRLCWLCANTSERVSL